MMILAVLLAALAPNVAGVPTDPPSLNVLSFNIRYANPGDAPHDWPNRRDRVAATIRFYEADLVGVQEALRSQLDDLQERLPGYAWLGAGRDDGADAGEFSAIVYRTDRLEPLESGTFWLSETPDVPGSKSWDAAITRVATWARFRDRSTGEAFLHLNTHFDHIGQEARHRSAQLITERLPGLAGDLPVVVTGDFNAAPDEPPYAAMTAALRDAYTATETPPFGPESTFTGFVVGEEPAPRRIDYVFVGDGVAVLRYGALNPHWNGAYASDHLAVFAEVVLP